MTETAANMNEKTHVIVDIAQNGSPPKKRQTSLLHSLFIHASAGDYLVLVPAVFVSAIFGLLIPAMTYVVGKTYDVLAEYQIQGPRIKSPHKLLSQVGSFCVIFVVLGAIAFTLSWIRFWCWTLYGERLARKLRILAYNNALKSTKPLQTTIITSDILTLSNAMPKVGLLASYIVTIISSIIYAFSLSPRLTLCILSIFPAILIVLTLTGLAASKPEKAEDEATKSLCDHATRALNCLRTVQTLNAETQEERWFSHAALAARNARKSLWLRAWAPRSALLRFCTLVMFVIGFATGSQFVNSGSLSPGQVLTVFWAVSFGGSYLQLSIPLLTMIEKAASASRKLKVILIKIDPVVYKSQIESRFIHACITFEDVYFAYSQDSQWVLKGLNMQIPCGAFVHIVGKSGNGKSTVASLIKYATETRTQRGTIYIGGIPINEINDWVERNVCMLSQKPSIFTGTVFENIAIGAVRLELVKPEDVKRACEIACFDYNTLPNKLDTVISEGTLSGGQIQRLCIARALMRSWAITIFDEATSAMDPLIRRRVQYNLRNVCKGRTCIFITHEMESIDPTDLVYIIEDGCVSASGTKEELIPIYPSLFKKNDKMTLNRRKESNGSSIAHPETKKTMRNRHRRRGGYIDNDNREAVMKMIRVKSLQTAFFLWQTLPNRVYYIFGVILCIIHASATPAFAFAFSRLLNSMVGNDGSNYSVFLAWVVFGICVGDSVADFGKNAILESISSTWAYSLRMRVYRKELQGSSSLPPSSQVKCLVDDVEEVSHIAGALIGSAIISAPTMILIGVIWALIIGWKMALLALAVLPLFGLTTWLQTKLDAKQQRQSVEMAEEIGVRLHETSSQRSSIHLEGCRRNLDVSFQCKVQEAFRFGIRQAFFTGFGFATVDFVDYSSKGLLFYFGAILMAYAGYSFQQMLTVFTLIIFSFGMAASITSLVPDLSRSAAACTNVQQELNRPALVGIVLDSEAPSSMSSSGLKKSSFPMRGAIQFNHVHFTYETRKETPVLANFSLEVGIGEVIAVVGPSGTGKSTIAKLLHRFENPESGNISIDSIDISRIDRKWLREKIVFAPQKGDLFQDMTITQNLVYGLGDVFEAQSANEQHKAIMEACRRACVDEFLGNLQSGFDTRLETHDLSGGQRQRLALARCLLRACEGRARILVLDEATSALDMVTGEKVLNNMVGNRGSRPLKMTILMITHQEQVMRRADRVIYVDDGQVLESGPFEDLMSNPKSYLREMLTHEPSV